MRYGTIPAEVRGALLEGGGPENLREVIKTAAELYGDKTAFSEIRGKDFVSYSYKRFYEDVNALGTALCSLGFIDRHIAVLGENSYFWIVSYFAAILSGVVVPLDKEQTEKTVKALMNKSHADAVICSGKWASAALGFGSELEKNITVVSWSQECENGALSFEGLLQKGKELLAGGETCFTQREQDAEKMSAILFTSGTTGANKGVMLSQKNICANLISIVKFIPIREPSFSVLPMNHAFEFNCHVLPAIFFGVEMAINSNMKYLLRNLRQYRPGMTVVVPLFVDEIYSGIIAKAKHDGKYKRLMAAVKISDFLRKLGIDLRRRIFKSLLENFGGNLSIMVCGGATINETAASALSSFGIDIIPGYGITECSPLVSADGEKHPVLTSVGRPVFGVEVKIASPDELGEGEILVRGNSVCLGYYEDEASNAVSFCDGWFRTGDFGKVDSDGRIYITGRKKNLIVLENGKNVHPEEVEGAIMEELGYIREVVVHEKSIVKGEKNHRCIAASISIRPDSELAVLVEDERNRIVAEDIRRVNKKLASYKRISKISVVLEEFEKTTTKKVIRELAVKGGTFITV
ncbi:MAG: AMP-binding protein [Clostridia bacterium]|nr:AMP-binding protein [Clostridia bacterium]